MTIVFENEFIKWERRTMEKFPFAVRVRKDPGELKKAWHWAKDTFGRVNYACSGSATKFYFKTEEDAVMFSLRWS